jgi:hypothetical protein
MPKRARLEKSDSQFRKSLYKKQLKITNKAIPLATIELQGSGVILTGA